MIPGSRERLHRWLGLAARSYIRYSPLTLGRKRAYESFSHHLGWRPEVFTARTMTGHLIEIELPDIVSKVIFLTGWWEHGISRYLMSVLSPGDTFIDVGANIGYYTLLASRLVGDSGTVYSIEASPRIADRLERNIQRNKLDNVKLIRAAVSSREQYVSVYAGPDTNVGATTTDPGVAGRKALLRATSVRADTLSKLVGPALFDARAIKVDVEGGEHEVLLPLDLHRFSTETEWLLEVDPYNSDAQAIVDRFLRAGYEALLMQNEYNADFFLFPKVPHDVVPLMTMPTELADLLFRRRER